MLTDLDSIRAGVKAARTWRETELERCNEVGLTDLTFRPRTGMSALGWVLAHQAAVFDFSLNMLINRGPPVNPVMFEKFRPGTSGDWDGTPLVTIHEYYDSGERELLEWAESVSQEELDRVIEEGTAPKFFVGMTIREVIANLFSHLCYHSGQLEAIRRDWMAQQQ